LIEENQKLIHTSKERIKELERKIRNVNSDTVVVEKNVKHALAINIPVDCVSKTDCYYLCDSFVNFGGISEDKANLEELAADLDTVETGDMNDNETISNGTRLL